MLLEIINYEASSTDITISGLLCIVFFIAVLRV